MQVDVEPDYHVRVEASRFTPSLCLEMTDDRWWRNRVWAGTKLKKVPSDYFRDHWLATVIVDRSGVAVRHLVGVDNMAWSTDFPHHGNDWAVLAPHDRHAVRGSARGGAARDHLHQRRTLLGSRGLTPVAVAALLASV
jgi:hypothetical protein